MGVWMSGSRIKFLLLATCLACLPAWGGQLFFAVNEGASSAQDALFRNQKYQGLVERIAQATGKKVIFESSNILSVLVRNLQKQRYDLALVRPSVIIAQAVRDHGYRVVAAVKGDIHVHFIVPRDSPLKDIREIQGKHILMPDKQSTPTQAALAVIRDLGLDPERERIQMLSQQAAVSYSLEHHLADVGVLAAPQLVQEWQKKGGRVLYVKDKLPSWAVIASPRVSERTVNILRNMLIDLEATPEGRGILKSIEVKGFAPGDQQAYLDMLRWMEGK